MSAPTDCSIEGCPDAGYSRGWCSFHYGCWYRTGDPLGGKYPMRNMSTEDRFWSKVDKAAPGGCWEWTAGKSEGYGVAYCGGEVPRLAHRMSYEMLRGDIPGGTELDHLCRNRACCNPSHLEPVEHRENILRSPIAPAAINAAKTECLRGHPFDSGNTHISPKTGARNCRTCRRDRARTSRARERSAR